MGPGGSGRQRRAPDEIELNSLKAYLVHRWRLACFRLCRGTDPFAGCWCRAPSLVRVDSAALVGSVRCGVDALYERREQVRVQLPRPRRRRGGRGANRCAARRKTADQVDSERSLSVMIQRDLSGPQPARLVRQPTPEPAGLEQMMEPAAGIAGAEIVPLRRIPDERGTILPHASLDRSPLHRVRRDLLHVDLPRRRQGLAPASGYDPELRLHQRTDQVGALRRPPGFADERDAVGAVPRPDDYRLVAIPPSLWSGFKGMAGRSLVANCATHPHDPSRTERIDPFGTGSRTMGVRHR